MARSNLTLQLDDDVIRVAQEIAALVERDDRFEAARRRALDLLDGSTPLGGRSWTRDDIYAERLDRYGG
jgi:hypothetical protein